jgi:eukaryotic-like serine/threonine-protein kinase
MQPTPPRSNSSSESTEAAPSDSVVSLGGTQVGRWLKDKWRLDALLGIGGMAAVYAATHRNGNRVAIKMLHPRLSVHTADRDRFLREGYLSNYVDHRDAVRVLDEDVDEDGTVFLVMELLDGELITSRWQAAGRRLPTSEALWIAHRLLEVLEVAHAKGIIHRDLKPDNLFLTSDGRLKVLDFGIARLGTVSSGATLRGFVLGTPGFAAPEQARADWDHVDARADLWSVGATVFALVTGQVIHHELTPRAHLLRTSREAAPLVHEVDPTVPQPIATMLNRALAFQPQDRFQTASEMRQAVRLAYWLTTGEHMPEQLPWGSGGSVGAPPILSALTLGSSGTRPSPRRSGTSAMLAPALTISFAIAVIVLVYLLSPNRARATKVANIPEIVTPPPRVLVDPTPIPTAAAEALDDVMPAEPEASAPRSIPPIPIRSGVAATAAGERGSRGAAAIPWRAGRVATGTGAAATSASSRSAVAPPRNVAEPTRGSSDRLDFVDNRH